MNIFQMFNPRVSTGCLSGISVKCLICDFFGSDVGCLCTGLYGFRRLTYRASSGFVGRQIRRYLLLTYIFHQKATKCHRANAVCGGEYGGHLFCCCFGGTD